MYLLIQTQEIHSNAVYMRPHQTQRQQHSKAITRRVHPWLKLNIRNVYLMQVLSQPNIIVACDICDKNITFSMHLMADGIDYCAKCFANLDPFPEEYSIQNGLNYSLTNADWLCIEEILLLVAFQKWGFANWDQITDFMNFNGSKFTKKEIQDHYERYYLSSENFMPLISSSLMETSKSTNAKDSKRYSGVLVNKIDKKNTSQLKSQQSLPAPKKKPEALQENILGYNPKRKSFNYDLEYDEKAECLLSDLEFKDDDTPEQIQLKFKIIQSYNKRLDERLKRYKFTIDHKILDIDYRFKKDFSANKYQKEAFLLFRPFTRFQTHEQNQRTMELIANNNYYKSMIQGLKKCRRKIDKEGRIQETLNFLKQREKETEFLGKPRKIYHIDRGNQTMGEEEILQKFQEQLQKQSESSDTKLNLKVVYRSQ